MGSLPPDPRPPAHPLPQVPLPPLPWRQLVISVCPSREEALFESPLRSFFLYLAEPKCGPSWVLLGLVTPLSLPRPWARCQLPVGRRVWRSRSRLALGFALKGGISSVGAVLTSEEENDSCVICVAESVFDRQRAGECGRGRGGNACLAPSGRQVAAFVSGAPFPFSGTAAGTSLGRGLQDSGPSSTF